MGQRCFPNPVISNDEGTERLPYVPTGREIVGTCRNENGREVDGLTYEGELNKVGTHACFFGRACDVLRFVDSFHRCVLRRDLTPCAPGPADNICRVLDVHGLDDILKGLAHWCPNNANVLDTPLGDVAASSLLNSHSIRSTGHVNHHARPTIIWWMMP